MKQLRLIKKHFFIIKALFIVFLVDNVRLQRALDGQSSELEA